VKYLSFLLIIFLVCPMVLSDAFPHAFTEVPDTFDTQYEHGPRIDASLALMHDTFTCRDRAFLYGGRGKNDQGQEVFMDYHGELWAIRPYPAFMNTVILWERWEPDLFVLRDLDCPITTPTPVPQDEEYPPLPRFGHSAVICVVMDGSIMHNTDIPTEDETYMNYVVFGGKRQQVRNANNLVIAGNSITTDEVYVFTEYRIDTGTGKQTRHHWYRVEPEDANETWPGPRMYAQMVPLFNEQDPVENRNTFLLFGGIDPNGAICTDAYVGTLTRDLQVQPPENNEWDFDTGLDVTFEEVTLDTTTLEAISVHGASVIYDPYFNHPAGVEHPEPRVLILGGVQGAAGGIATSKIYSIQPQDGSDWTDLEGTELIDADMGASHKRAFFSAVINYRYNRIEIAGGETQGLIRDEIGYLDLLNLQDGWTWFDGPGDGSFPAVSHHHAYHSHATGIYCVENWSTAPERKLYVDKYFHPDDHNDSKTWEISKSARYGLTNPEAVANTRRLREGDTLYIRQEHDYPGAVNDCYRCSLNVPSWCKNVTIEGEVYNGVKPILYQLYAPPGSIDPAWYLEGGDGDRFSRYMMEVIYSHAAMTMKNLKICHFETEPSGPEDLLPTDIPSAQLEGYSDYESPSSSHRDWLFAAHHVDDAGMFMHAQSNLKNCDFYLNGVGIAMICVSSAIEPTQVTGCTFESNFMGVVALEKDHHIAYNTFKDNYVAGLAIDKGSSTNVRENLFTGDGRLSFNPDNIYGLEDYSAAILCDFATTTNVPLIQTPFIYNNTFVNNYRALTIKDDGYLGQYMNRPFFFNNIVYDPQGTQSPVFIDDSGNRSDLICRNNCFYPAQGIDIIETDDPASTGFVLASTLEQNPLLELPGYTLASNSPCIDQGLYLLQVGISSLLNYPDYRTLDIGYHYPLYTGIIPGAPENLSVTPMLTYLRFEWDSVSGVSGYRIFVEKDDGSMVTELTSQTDFEYNPGGEEHLWFGVMSHQNQEIYSECVWLEWIGEKKKKKQVSSYF